MLVLALAVLLALLIYFFGFKPLKYWEEKGVPALKAWPFVGNIASVVFRTRPFAHILNEAYQAFPERRYFGYYNLNQPFLMIRDPELIKRITVKEFDTFPEHRFVISEDVDPLFAKNLFSMRGGQRWQDMRSTLSPSFTSSKMKMMFELMKDCAKQFSNHFEKQTGIITVQMKDVFTRFANDVIATTAFGITCDSLKNPDNEFYKMGKEATTFTAFRILQFTIQIFSPTLGKLLGVTIFSKAVSNFFRSLIKETLKVREEQAIVRPDMIHLLMEARKGRLKHEDHGPEDSGFAVVQESELGKVQKRQKAEITDDDITAQALIFFFAGFDTVSTCLSYTTYELAVNPDVQEKLRKEVDAALEKCNRSLTYETLMSMKYIDMVVTESLRKWPPFAHLERKSVKPFTIEPECPGEKPLHLPADSVCFIPVYGLHRDPQYYPDPDKYDPERFSEENKHNVKPFTYLPFGSGPRNCIGSRFALLEIKLVLTEILSKFEIIPVEKTRIPVEITKKGIIPSPADGVWLGFKPRKLQ